MVRTPWLLISLCACGRISFDPHTVRDAAGDTRGADTAAELCPLDASWTPEWSSMIEYLPFDGTGPIADSSTVPAVVGFAGTATNVNGAGMAYVPGKIGQAIRFDGVDDVVALNVPPIDTTAGHSVSVGFWLDWDGTYYSPGGWTMLINFTQINLLLDNQGTPPHTIGFNTNNGDNWGTSNTGLANRWVHVVGVFYNGSSDLSQLYIDGQMITAMETEGTAHAATVSSAIKIAAYPSYPNYLSGAIDEVAIWNRALTPAEVQTLYARQVGCD